MCLNLDYGKHITNSSKACSYIPKPFSDQLALIMFPAFVHSACRHFRWSGLSRAFGLAQEEWVLIYGRKIVQTRSFRENEPFEPFPYNFTSYSVSPLDLDVHHDHKDTNLNAHPQHTTRKPTDSEPCRVEQVKASNIPSIVVTTYNVPAALLAPAISIMQLVPRLTDRERCCTMQEAKVNPNALSPPLTHPTI
jgi:hypothetical protein